VEVLVELDKGLLRERVARVVGVLGLPVTQQPEQPEPMVWEVEGVVV